ncbi:MAG TPA: thiamine pyrophosphate-dependent enzyme [candidate division Zixibacteria bacterium]|nr:thiamine pyrophosphate-dependent enzyme [candidate division Zixibacteria bacterium]
MSSEYNPLERESVDIDRRSREMARFEQAVLQPYLQGKEDHGVVGDELAARSLIPPDTAQRRSFKFISPEIPVVHPDNCTACMECVVICPDVAIRTRAITKDQLEAKLEKVADPQLREGLRKQFTQTRKLWSAYESKGEEPAYFSLWIDPDRCKGCGVCVEVCDTREALSMREKSLPQMLAYSQGMEFIEKELPPTPEEYISEKRIADQYLRERCWVTHGGAGSCAGCGEITAINMAVNATAIKYGKNMSIVAATGCNTVYSSTYPYNIFNVPWINSLFENAPATAMGVRMRLDQEGKQDSKIWVLGGDGAMFDIGLQSLSRLLTTTMDINVLVLDTQSYSNTGGQASTGTYLGQNAKMSVHGSKLAGKQDRRKELGLLAMAHPDVFVAQVSPAYYTHFFKTVLAALEYPGPSVIIAYSSCTPEHQIADNLTFEQAKNAVDSRAFPLYVYDPRNGDTFRERLSLSGNPSVNRDWHHDSRSGELRDFVWFAGTEGRFAKQFDKDGHPSPTLLASQEDRLKNWRLLQDLAGVTRREEETAAA